MLILFMTTLFGNCKPELNSLMKARIEQKLKVMREADQIAANFPQGKYKSYPKEVWEKFKDSVFTANKRDVEELFRHCGFPGFNLVSRESSHSFWLIVQHCDQYPDF